MKKQGISLIVLIITIVVIIILSSVVILTVINDAIFDDSGETVFKEDASAYKHEFETYLQNEVLKDIFYQREEVAIQGKEIANVIKSIKPDDVNKFIIYEGELIFVGTNEEERKWAKEAGVKVIDINVIDIVNFVQVDSTYNSITLSTTMKDKLKNYKFHYELLDINGNVIFQAERKELIPTNTNTFTFSNLKATLDDKYAVKVTVSYYGITDTATIGEVELDKISPYFEYSQDWTKELDVTVKVPTTIEGYNLEIITPSSEITEIKMTNSGTILSHLIKVYNNGTLIARVKDTNGNIYSESSCNIENIDNISPSAPTEVSVTTTSSTATATATGSTDNVGGIGFDKYQYSLDNISWQDSPEFTGIRSETNVVIYARAVDKLGNVSSVTSSAQTATDKLGKVTFSKSTSAWTKNDITLSISHNKAGKDGYLLMYCVDGGTWNIVTNGASSVNVNISQNSSITARIYNSTLDDEGDSLNTCNITNIDKVAPNAPTSLTLTPTTTSIKATATGGTDNYGVVSHYEYSIDASKWQTSNTFSSLLSATSYTVYARTVDKAGNVSEVYQKSAQTNVALKASFSGSNYTSNKNETSCSIIASGVYGTSPYTYSKNGTLTITGIPQGAVISFTITASTSNDMYGNVLGTSSASIKFGSKTVASGTNINKTATYTTTETGTLTCSVSSSNAGYTGKVIINSITHNGETLIITY